MLASDVNNPEFVGAQNPDRMLAVEFKEIPVKNGVESEKSGRPVYDAVLHCIITPPGNLLSVPAICTEDHKRRFPFHWQQYQNNKGVGLVVQGTPIDEWPALDVGQRETLKASKFYTVEQIANASDAQVQMMGMGGMAMRQKAAAWLNQAQGSAAAMQQAAENESLKRQLATMQEQINAISPKAETVTKVDKPKRVLSEAHKAAMKAGKEAKKAAA